MMRLVTITILLAAATAVTASPYYWSHNEDFEQGAGDWFAYNLLVEDPPASPGDAYVWIGPGAFDGSLGLHMVQNGYPGLPGFADMHPSCTICPGGEFTVELAARPGVPFGFFDVAFVVTGQELLVLEYTEPGAYTHIFDDHTMVMMTFFSGRDVIVDNLTYGWMCDCHVPNEHASWGLIKQSYR